jgi:hypothetical protein
MVAKHGGRMPGSGPHLVTSSQHDPLREKWMRETFRGPVDEVIEFPKHLSDVERTLQDTDLIKWPKYKVRRLGLLTNPKRSPSYVAADDLGSGRWMGVPLRKSSTIR